MAKAKRALALTLLLAAPLGCSDPESGTLTVEYKLGSGDPAICTDFDISGVRATLGEEEFIEEAPCGDPILISGIPAGKWDLLVEAVAPDGTVVMDNEFAEERVEILAGSSTTVEPQLTATPARVYVRWSINLDSFPAQCSDPAVETAQFRVQTWDASQNLLAEETFPCDAPTDPDAGSYRRLADPDRKIAGNQLDQINIEALDAAGAGLTPVPLFDLAGTPPGPGRAVYLTVECNDNACMSTGDAPFDTK
jgi:hypothetical protein